LLIFYFANPNRRLKLKQMKKKNLLWSVFLLLVLGACDKTAQQVVDDEKQTVVQFTSVVEGDAVTRATGSSWAANDRIGVFMKQAGGTLGAGTIVGEGDNVPFITKQGNGNFLSDGKAIEYPSDGSAVDFIAYYPYQSTLDNYIYKVDVTNQSKPEEIDLLYADNLTNRTATSTTGNLQFYHQLSQLVLNLSSSDNTDFSNLSVTISGVKTKANFNLVDGSLTVDEKSIATVTMRRVGNAAEAILLPANTINGIKLTLTLNGKTKEITLPTSITSLEQGAKHIFSVNIKNGGSQVDPEEGKYAKWRETPVITKNMLEKSNIKYINHYMPDNKKYRNYSLLYDTNLKMAYWVAYPIYEGCVGSFQRQDDWIEDPELDGSLQANFNKAGDMFKRGYNRGHQIPSKDRTGNGAMNATTFYYTNATPQKANMNGQIWARLEDAVRRWNSSVDTVFVVTGAMAKESENDVVKYEVDCKNGKVVVPKYYYKAVARELGSTFYTIAFKIPNDDAIAGRDYMDYACSVEDLEKITGFTFFPTLSADIKRQCDKSKWR
jgi:endonuclease G